MIIFKSQNGDLIAYIPLATRIIVVAHVNKSVGDWSAYIGTTGDSHEGSVRTVLAKGTKVDQFLAEYWFPDYKQYRWRN
jgi:hypothetical protein